MADFFTLATNKLGLNLVGSYDRLCWRQQMDVIPTKTDTHTHTKVKEKQQTWWTLVQRDMLPGEGREGASNPIQLSVLVLDCLLLLYMAHVIYSIQVIFNPYYVTR